MRRPAGAGARFVASLVGVALWGSGAAAAAAQEAPAPGARDAAQDGGHSHSRPAEPAVPTAEGPPELPEPGGMARVIDRPEQRRLEVVVGPFEIPPGQHLRLPIQLVELPVAGWLHGFEWSMTDGAGEPLPDDLLHHVNLLQPNARELFSPIPRRVMAAGRETKSQEMPRLIGYPVETSTPLLVAAMVTNPGEHPIREAVLRVRLDYTLDEDGWIDPRDVYPFYLDVMGPVGPKSFPVPPGRTVKSWEGKPAVGGRIMAIGGHLHDYGEELRLIDVTAGDTLWRGRPVTDEEGQVVSVPSGKLWWRGGAKIRPDHTYRIEVVYENPTGEPTPDGGMGAIGGVLLAPGAEWPELDRHDPAYATDLRTTLELPHRAEGHGHGHGAH